MCVLDAQPLQRWFCIFNYSLEAHDSNAAIPSGARCRYITLPRRCQHRHLVRNLTAAIHRQNGRLGDDGQFIQRKFSNEAHGILALMLKK